MKETEKKILGVIFLIVVSISIGYFLGVNSVKNISKTPTVTEPLQPKIVVSKNKPIEARSYEETPFKKGDDVEGKYIVFNNGEDGSLNAVYYEAYVKNSPYSGIVTDGTIWPTTFDPDYKQIDPKVDKPKDYYHTPRYSTEQNYTLSFEKGDTVYGYKLNFSNGKTYYWATIKNSPYSGTVSNGAVWPKYSDYHRLVLNDEYIRLVDPDVDQPWPRRHCTVPIRFLPVAKLSFEKGDNVIGDLTFSNGLLATNASIINSPLSGTINGDYGYLWPTDEYILEDVNVHKNSRLLTYEDIF